MTNEELEKTIALADFKLGKMKDDIHDLFDENKQLKERIDKAIEYIKSNELDIVMVELLEILGDKE